MNSPKQTAYIISHKRYYKLKADRPWPHDYSTHRQRHWTDNDSSLLLAALGKAEVKRFSCEMLDRQTDRRTLPSALYPCFAKLRGRQ